jgi:hypothetical protein
MEDGRLLALFEDPPPIMTTISSTIARTVEIL